MDKVAVISDIHGNVPAFEAVLDDIQARGIKTIYCLGDIAGKGPRGDKAIDLCREYCTGVVQGNWDHAIATSQEFPSYFWHRDQIGEERRQYLESLPPVINFQLSGRPIRLFHASQKSVYVRVYPHSDSDILKAMFTNSDFTGYDAPEPTVVGYGDIHSIYVLPLWDEPKILFNTGSVGNPLDEPTASYAILHGVPDGTAADPFSIETVRLSYDIERAVAEARAANMLDFEPYEIELRTAVYRRNQK